MKCLKKKKRPYRLQSVGAAEKTNKTFVITIANITYKLYNKNKGRIYEYNKVDYRTKKQTI